MTHQKTSQGHDQKAWLGRSCSPAVLTKLGSFRLLFVLFNGALHVVKFMNTMHCSLFAFLFDSCLPFYKSSRCKILSIFVNFWHSPNIRVNTYLFIPFFTPFAYIISGPHDSLLSNFCSRTMLSTFPNSMLIRIATNTIRDVLTSFLFF